MNRSYELQSAIIVILEHVVEKHPDIATLTLLSDSCVAQKLLCYAPKTFLTKHTDVTIIRKYCILGHSLVQDNFQCAFAQRKSIRDIQSVKSNTNI